MSATPTPRGWRDCAGRTPSTSPGRRPALATRSTRRRCSTSSWRRPAWAALQAPAPPRNTGRPPPVLYRRWRGTLRQPPPGDCFAALSFAICQVDEHGDLKLRRGEDWRRSGHNATMGASDVPTHHFLGDIVDLILRAWAEGWDPVVFGHDLQNARLG